MYAWDPARIAARYARPQLSVGAFELTYFYAALWFYLAFLTAFLGWWARFPR